MCVCVYMDGCQVFILRYFLFELYFTKLDKGKEL